MSCPPRIHLSFAVSDLDQSIRFYEDFLGEGPVKTKNGYAKFLPSFAPLNLALHPDRTTDTGAMRHLGIEVEDSEAVMRHLKRIKEAGLKVREEMNVDCCHANQDKFWVEDPDGREWEIYVLKHDLEDSHGWITDGCCADASH